MSQLQTFTEQTSGMNLAAMRPRISADAFRSLSARLKKVDVVVPPTSPLVQTLEMAFAPLSTQLEVIASQEPALTTSESTPELAVFAPPSAEAVAEPFSTDLLTPQALDVFAPIAGVELAQAHSFADEPAPLLLEPALSLEPAPAVKLFPALELPLGFAPAIEPTIAPAASVVPTEQAPIAFEQNFTPQPETEASIEAPKPNLSGVEEAIKAEIAQRAAEIELENIWRMMLAKPVDDDRKNYLREAAQIHSGDDEWNKLEPEHDLSLIAPAELLPVEESLEENLAVEAELPELAVAALVPEGQDLGELARSLLDMMAAGNASGLPQERALAADTLLRLVPKLELKPTIMLAQRLAMMEAPPHMLVAKLIRDPRVEVAGPLLEDCVQISDRDLESVVTESEPDKLRMIARRRHLSHAISDLLIKSGDPSVVLTLVRNMEAEISHVGFQSLLVLAENHEELLAPMATRKDFTAQYAFELFWLAPSQLRRFILSRFLTDSETLTKILKITMATKLDEEGEPEPLNQHVLLEGLERAARGQTDIAAEELSGTMQLSTATIQKILSDHQGDALVVMLKAAGYPRSAVLGLLKRMQNAELPLVTRERDVSELQSMFETLSFNKARILLTYWDWAQSKTGPYALAH
jgi:uncharacterized protein (DUF2336 family)